MDTQYPRLTRLRDGLDGHSILVQSENKLMAEKIKILKDLTSNFRDKTVIHKITGTDMVRSIRDGKSIDSIDSLTEN